MWASKHQHQDDINTMPPFPRNCQCLIKNKSFQVKGLITKCIILTNVIVMSSLCYPNYTIFGMLFCLNGLVIHYIWALQGLGKGSEAQISCNKDIFVLRYLLNMWWNDMLSSLSDELSGFRFVHVIPRVTSVLYLAWCQPMRQPWINHTMFY